MLCVLYKEIDSCLWTTVVGYTLLTLIAAYPTSGSELDIFSSWLTLFETTVEVKLTCLIWSSNKIPLRNIRSELHLERLICHIYSLLIRIPLQ